MTQCIICGRESYYHMIFGEYRCVICDDGDLDDNN